MEEHEQEAEYSPPLFIQFVLTISQDSEDIVCSAIKHLPTCLAELLQVLSPPILDLASSCLTSFCRGPLCTRPRAGA